jgi:hypothetical protein
LYGPSGPKPVMDQPRIGVPQHTIREAEARQHAGAEIVDQHIRPPNQFEQDFFALGAAQIQRQAALVAVVSDEMRTIKITAEVAEGIAALAVLDLDHGGAQIGQQHAGERAGNHGGEFKHPHTVKHAAHVSSPWRQSFPVSSRRRL